MSVQVKDKHLIGALPLIASALADKYGVQVRFGNYPTAATDGQTIFMPHLPVEGSKKLQVMCNGYLDHEVGHVRITDMAAFNENKKPIEQHLLNVLEDLRIETHMAKRYPGTVKSIRKLMNQLIEDGTHFSAPQEDEGEASILVNAALIIGRCEVLGQDMLKEYADQYRKLFVSTFGAKSMDVLDRAMHKAPALKDAFEVLAMARELIKDLLSESEQEQQEQQKQQEQEQQKKSSDQDPSDEEGAEQAPGESDDQSGEDQNEESGDPEEGSGEKPDSGDKKDGEENSSSDTGDEGGDEGKDDQSGSSSGTGSEGDEDDGEDDSSGAGDKGDDEGKDGQSDSSSGTGDQGDQGEKDEQASGSGTSSDEKGESGQSPSSEKDAQSRDQNASKDSDKSGSDDQSGSEQSGSSTNSGTEDGEQQGGSGAGQSTKSFNQAMQDAINAADTEIEASSDLGEAISQQIKGALDQPAAPDAGYKIRDLPKERHISSSKKLAVDPSKVKGATTKLRARLYSLIETKLRERRYAAQTGRKLEQRNLSYARTGERNLFAKKDEKNGIDTAIHLLIDTSGSMGSLANEQGVTRRQLAAESAYAILGAVEGVKGVSTGCSTFPQHGHWKRFEESLANAQGRFIPTSGGSTPLTEAMLWSVRDQLSQRRESRKIFIVITDGVPANPHTAKKTVEMMEKSGVEAIGVGIGTEAAHCINDIFPPKNGKAVADVNKLPQVLFDLLKERLL